MSTITSTLCRISVVNRRPVAVTVELAGEVDWCARPELDRAVDAVAAMRTQWPVVVDLTWVTFADSTLVRVLLQLEDIAGDLGVAFRICGATPATRRLLLLTGLDRLLVSAAGASHR